jgi:hypothetical protein
MRLRFPQHERCDDVLDEAGTDPAPTLRHLNRGDHRRPEDVHQIT